MKRGGLQGHLFPQSCTVRKKTHKPTQQIIKTVFQSRSLQLCTLLDCDEIKEFKYYSQYKQITKTGCYQVRNRVLVSTQ